MASTSKKPAVAEFGDFQTPRTLARQVCKLLADRGLFPAAIVEPTCGIGNFLFAALEQFPAAASAIGVEINSGYVEKLMDLLGGQHYGNKVRVLRESFFHADWPTLLTDLAEPLLVIGNPPWVTNAELGSLKSKNLPKKSNFQNHNGLDALTGKSNFDISEWMLIKLLDLLAGREATLAMLCKTAVARKVLVHAWKNGIGLPDAEIHTIDTATFFDAAVDACLLICRVAPGGLSHDCRVFGRLGGDKPARVIGYRDGWLIADVAAYNRWKHLEGEEIYKWRSGIKHDCSAVMELRKEGHRYRNGLGELVDLEDDYLYPMLKSSELANGHTEKPKRRMLVTQRRVGEDTAGISERAPKTWKYLRGHGEALDRRASSIYRNRPRFSVFGVGDYSFAPWKVAISGFYKKLQFTVVGNVAGTPIVLDDTAYFVACRSEAEARYVAALLNSEAARAFFSAFVFWDAKRPVTVELLRRLDLGAVAREVGAGEAISQFQEVRRGRETGSQGGLWEIRVGTRKRRTDTGRNSTIPGRMD